MDVLSKRTGHSYTLRDVQNDQNRLNLKKFTSTGAHWTTCDTTATDDDVLDDADFSGTQRASKINKTCYVIEPSNLLKKFHRRTHFEAASSMAHELGAMKVKNRLLNMQFIEIQQNFQANSNLSVNQTVQSDDEDARLVREQRIQNSIPDYSGLSREVLKLCGKERSPLPAKQFLRSGSQQRSSRFAHLDTGVRQRVTYGRFSTPTLDRQDLHVLAREESQS